MRFSQIYQKEHGGGGGQSLLIDAVVVVVAPVVAVDGDYYSHSGNKSHE